MATSDEYKAVEVALIGMLQADINTKVPVRWRGLIPHDLVPMLAKECAQMSVDTLDKYRANKAAGAT